MSVHVLSRFLKESQSEVGARLVGIVMAHAAGDDGICWMSQENLASQSHLSIRGLRAAIRKLEELTEIETRQVQRGRSRVNVYRVWCGDVPQYERLPFAVDDPFSAPPAESAASRDDRQIDARPPEDDDVDDRQIDASTPSLERKENVRTKEELAAVPAATAYDPLKGMKLDGRNLPWDALVEVTQADEKVEAGKIAASLKKIRGFVAAVLSPQAINQAPAHCEQMIAQQIRARARMYRQRWPQMELTPTALAANWARVTTPAPGGSPDTAMDAAQRGIDEARRTA